MSEESRKSTEFRRYRQALTGLYILVAGAGATLLTASVIEQLLFRRPPVELGAPAVSERDPDPAVLLRCNQDLLDLLLRLGSVTARLLAQPLAGDHPRLAAQWEEFSEQWSRDRDEVDARCRFSELADARLGVAYDRMAQVHGDLPTIRLKYQSLIIRFDEEQAAELTRMRRALDQSRTALLKRSLREGRIQQPRTGVPAGRTQEEGQP